MTEEELSKEERLEAARKKFEELKKKNKKGKKKGKKSAKSEEPEDKSEEITPEIEDNEKVGNAETSETEKVSEALQKTDLNATENDTASMSNEIPAKPGKDEESLKAAPQEVELSANTLIATGASNTAKDTSVESEDEVNLTEETTTDVDISRAKEVTSESEDLTSKSKKSELENLLEGASTTGESNFLTETLHATIKELKLQNESIKAELSAVKAESLDLKLTKMDIELALEEARNENETQRKQIERLTQQLRAEQAYKITDKHNDDGMSVLSGSEYLHHGASSFQNLASFNLNNGSQDYMDIVDVKERLQQWKGWNMDMHGWRSIGMGPVVQF